MLHLLYQTINEYQTGAESDSSSLIVGFLLIHSCKMDQLILLSISLQNILLFAHSLVVEVLVNDRYGKGGMIVCVKFL